MGNEQSPSVYCRPDTSTVVNLISLRCNRRLRRGHINVNLSSTYLDLRRHRKAIALALRKAQYQGTMMEEYAGARCDAYVGVFAWRYGYLPKGKGNLKRVSATELEYAAAKRKKNGLCCSCPRFDHWSLANGFLTAGVWISEQIVPERALLGDSPALSQVFTSEMGQDYGARQD